jgi:hypothetical protein|tara:strand:- start:1429 stop:1545 length:117 start_codon:yes stop_codon:yes gene_type:complete
MEAVLMDRCPASATTNQILAAQDEAMYSLGANVQEQFK